MSAELALRLGSTRCRSTRGQGCTSDRRHRAAAAVGLGLVGSVVIMQRIELPRERQQAAPTMQTVSFARRCPAPSGAPAPARVRCAARRAATRATCRRARAAAHSGWSQATDASCPALLVMRFCFRRRASRCQPKKRIDALRRKVIRLAVDTADRLSDRLNVRQTRESRGVHTRIHRPGAQQRSHGTSRRQQVVTGTDEEAMETSATARASGSDRGVG